MREFFIRTIITIQAIEAQHSQVGCELAQMRVKHETHLAF